MARQRSWMSREHLKMLAERDAQWDADRARYGMACPQYQRPESFAPSKWALWAAEHPDAINVVAWRAEGEVAPVPRPAPDPVEAAAPTAAVETQLGLF